MKEQLARLVLCLATVSTVSSEYYKGEYVSTHPDPETFDFRYKSGDCYELYGPNETVDPFSCRWLNLSKVACIKFNSPPSRHFFFDIRTPSNETVIFIHNAHRKEKLPLGCFEVIGNDNKSRVVCQKLFDKYSIGLTTPDNYTMLFRSEFCTTVIIPYRIEDLNNRYYTSNYTFDPQLRSCYKVYNPGEKPSSYTCLKEGIPETCAYRYNSSCLGVTTVNNDTILLDCKDGVKEGCFNVIDKDGKISEACQQKFDDRCISLLMPSNLTVLLECYFCYNHDHEHHYHKETQRLHRQFIKKWFAEEISNPKSYLDMIEFLIFKSNEKLQFYPCMITDSKVYPYWKASNNNTSHCWSVTLPSNETIEFECSGSEKKSDGCFNVYSPEHNKKEICLRVIQEKCVGLKTPLGYFLLIDCYADKKCYKEEEKSTMEQFKNLTAEEYTLFPFINNCYEVFYDKPTDKSCISRTNLSNYACLNIHFDGDEYCYAIETPKKEIIGFLCHPEKSVLGSLEYLGKMTGCFKVKHEDKTVEKVCQRKIGDYSIGLTTSKNSSVLLASLFCEEFMIPEQIELYSAFSKNFTFDPDIRSCYKVYEENEIISPYSCNDKNIFDACLQNLPNYNSCEGIITQNNETVLLNCNGKKYTEEGCFEIFASSGEKSIACHKKVEDRCIGVVTPSNLTVLLECVFCNSLTGSFLPPYYDENRKTFRKFVTTALSNFKNGNYTFNMTKPLYAYEPDEPLGDLQRKTHVRSYFPHLLRGHFNCVGVTTIGLETIVLDCPDDKTYEKRGCFEIFGSHQGPNSVHEAMRNTVCVQLLDEQCIGIITPENWAVPLACADRYENQ